MNLQEAYDLLSTRDESQRNVWPFPTDFTLVITQDEEEHHIRCDGWGIAATAAASFTGRLDQAETAADLEKLIAETQELIGTGAATLNDLQSQWQRVYELAYGSPPPV